MSRKSESIISFIPEVDKTKRIIAMITEVDKSRLLNSERIKLKKVVLLTCVEATNKNHIISKGKPGSQLEPIYRHVEKTLDELTLQLKSDILTSEDLRTIQYKLLNLNQAIRACLGSSSNLDNAEEKLDNAEEPLYLA